MSSKRRTKIVATLGPASESAEVIEALILAGMDVARLNFSHGTAEDHRSKAKLVRSLAAKHQRYVAIMGDLQGPKIRIARFKNKKIHLSVGQPFILSNKHPANDGNEGIVGVDYPPLVNDCGPGDELLLDDGKVILHVDKVENDAVYTTVVAGGELSDHKGVNRRGGGISAPSLTEKDHQDIKLAAELGVDYVAVSFPRYGSDMEEARKLVQEAGSQAWLIAKIERAEAVADDEALDDIIAASDGVMVARGDLGVEIGDARLVGIQKRIIQHARTLNKVVITATQMMESMISSPIPTRAEVSDVANAVLDYTDAVMLSAESAAGKFPIEAVTAMARICVGAEQEPVSIKSQHRLWESFSRCDDTIALSAMYAANHFPGIKAIISLTESGHTPLVMSRIRSGIPIFCFTRHVHTQNRAAMIRGVYSMPFDASKLAPNEVNQAAIALLKEERVVKAGDWVVLTQGELDNEGSGGTNGMKILTVQ